MGWPEHIEPREDEPAPTIGRRQTDRNRPDWLVGAEEGTQAEIEGEAPADASLELTRPDPGIDPARKIVKLPAPMLSRPDGKPVEQARPASAADTEQGSGAPVPWTAAASSVPKLAIVSSASRRPEPTALDDLEGDERPALHPGSLDDDLPTGVDDADGPAAALKPLEEPWWIVWLETLATNRKLQIGILVALGLAISGWIFWPRQEHGVSISQIKHQPRAFENQTLRVSGKVGEVFELGQGYVFNLHQGRDTLVVFTRSRVPTPHEKVVVVGSVSTGYLDGVARVALFENATP